MIVLDGSAAVDMARETSEGLALAQLLLDGEKVISHDLLRRCATLSGSITM